MTRMFSLAILKTDIRGMNYGMGTYLSQLTASLIKYPNIKIYLINYASDKYNNLNIFKSKNGIINIHIPAPKIFTDDEKHRAKHSSRVIDLLTCILNSERNLIFQVNYPSVLPLVKEIKKRFKCPVLSIIHSAAWQFLYNGNKLKFENVWVDREKYENSEIKRLIEEKELYELVDKIVSVTSYMKKFVSEYFEIPESKVSVIRNGIDHLRYKYFYSKKKITIKKQLGFKADERIIVFSGRLDFGKGLHLLLQAFNEVFKLNKNISLVIMGEDSGIAKIRDLLTYCKGSWSKVIFTGFLNYKDVYKFYQIADLGIIPSLYDHCPYAVLEMMSFHIPLIISNTEGLNEMLTKKQAIYIDPIYDIDGNISFNISEMANAILLLLNNGAIMNSLVSNYKELLCDRFSADRMAEDLYNVLRSMIGVDVKESELVSMEYTHNQNFKYDF